jgi:hypothetical protein
MIEGMRPPRTTLPAPTDRLALGDSGLRVSPFCLGLVSEPAAVSAAFDAGINFFFITADMHWPIYQPLRRGLADLLARGGGIRDEIVVAGCAYVAQPVFLFMPFKELVDDVPGLDRLELLVAGGAYAGEIDVRWPSYREHKQKGLLGARAIGASYHDRKAALAAVTSGEPDIAYIRYNPLHPGAARDLFPQLPDPRQTLVYNFKSTFGCVSEALASARKLPEGFWVPEAPDYYRYALTRPELDGCLVALDVPAHATTLADHLADGPLSPDEEEHFRLLAELAFGPKPERAA